MRKSLQWNAILALVLCLLAGSAMAQERTISGRVVSGDDGTALPGVNVVVKGTTNGTVTDADGNYRVAATGSNIVLVFSFIGLQTQEVSAGERSTVDVTMAADVTQLAEIVVTSQGIEKETRAIGYSFSARRHHPHHA